DYPISIHGHTDDQPPRNAALINNWYVSATRAAKILQFFIEEGGIDPNRLSGYGYAGYSPLESNTTPQKRARNRRIDLVLDATHKMAVEGYQRKTWKPKPLDFKGFKFKLL
ncbi:MAG: OmpA family protein, partial [Deltaproteobacteria bacterium]|nr:OmpA family protein [Deltaproteobacteria bacterium]